MKLTGLALLLVMSFGCANVFAASSPVGYSDPIPSLKERKSTTKKTLHRVFANQLKALKKIEFRSIHKILNIPEKRKSNQFKINKGAASLILGVSSLILLFSPLLIGFTILPLLSIPAAIFAIIFGKKSSKESSNAKADIGIITGIITLIGVILLIIILASCCAFGF